MDYLKGWAAGLIASLLITAMLKFLVPAGSIKKTANAVISIIVLIMLVSPLGKTGTKEWQIPDFDIDYDILQSENTVYADAIKQAVEDALNENSIEYNFITVDAALSDDGYIEINRIEIELKDINNSDTAIRAISEKTGIERGCITVYD